MRVRKVACAWCAAEIAVAAPDVDDNAYFLLPRQCNGCAGHNLVEIVGPRARAKQRKRAERDVTQKIFLL